MPPTNLARPAAELTVLTTILIGSCESPDGCLAEFAQRANEQQVRQNERMAEQSQTVAQQSHEVASAGRELVQQDAAARRELIEGHEKLQLQNQIWLATSPAQLKMLWTKVAELLNDKMTPLQQEAIAIPPIEIE